MTMLTVTLPSYSPVLGSISVFVDLWLFHQFPAGPAVKVVDTQTISPWRRCKFFIFFFRQLALHKQFLASTLI